MIKKEHALLGAVFIAGALLSFLTTYKLTESPPTWYDEGHITQIAINIPTHGLNAALQVAPGEYVSGAFSATTGYPVTLPVAASFLLFGFSILSARIVMAVYILLFVFCAWQLAKRIMSPVLAAYSLWMLATFAPIYGNGKTVLGEVPGLFFLTLFLLLIEHIEKGQATKRHFFAAGLCLGLTVVAKPIFLLVLPAVLIVMLFSRKFLTVGNVAWAAGAWIVAVGLWVWIQFGGQSIAATIAYYFNPFGIDTAASVSNNALLFVTELQPLYALVLLLVWLAAVLLRVKKGETIRRAEWIAFAFACITYLAFLRITPYYRYFFIGEVFAVLFFPYALSMLWPRRIPKQIFHFLLVGLIVFQTYQCFFGSFVAEYYNSHRSVEIAEAFSTLATSTSIFVYNAPELVLFLPPENPYYQYLNITPVLIIGADQLPLITNGVPDLVVLKAEEATNIDLSRYSKEKAFNRYELWKRK